MDADMFYQSAVAAAINDRRMLAKANALTPAQIARVKDDVIAQYPNGCPILSDGPQKDDL